MRAPETDRSIPTPAILSLFPPGLPLASSALLSRNLSIELSTIELPALDA